MERMCKRFAAVSTVVVVVKTHREIGQRGYMVLFNTDLDRSAA